MLYSYHSSVWLSSVDIKGVKGCVRKGHLKKIIINGVHFTKLDITEIKLKRLN